MPGLIYTSAGPKVWHWVLFIVVLGMLATLVLPAISKWQRRRARKTIHLELANDGNARSRYALHATEPTGNLAFHFRASGKPLPEQVVTVSAVSRQPSAVSGQRSAVSQKAAGAGAAPAKPGGPDAKKMLSGAAQTGGVVAGLLATLGRLLPGAAGQSLTGIGREVRQGQQTATQVKQVSQYAGKLQPKPGGSAQPPTVSSQPSAISRQPSVVSGQREVGSAVIEIWAQTPFVEPGQKMHVDLHIQPTNPYQTRHYPYVIKSRSLEYKEAPVVAEEETVLFEALNPFERFAPFMLFAAGVMVLLILFLSLW